MVWLLSGKQPLHPLARQFGAVLRRRREQAGLSQEALAATAGLHRNTVGLLERGERVPTLVVVQQVATALGVTMAVLVGEAEREPDPDDAG